MGVALGFTRYPLTDQRHESSVGWMSHFLRYLVGDGRVVGGSTVLSSGKVLGFGCNFGDVDRQAERCLHVLHAFY
jgi:hypothetical protein